MLIHYTLIREGTGTKRTWHLWINGLLAEEAFLFPEGNAQNLRAEGFIPLEERYPDVLIWGYKALQATLWVR